MPLRDRGWKRMMCDVSKTSYFINNSRLKMNLKPEVIYLVKCRVLTAGKRLNIESSGVVERKWYYFAGSREGISNNLCQPFNRNL